MDMKTGMKQTKWQRGSKYLECLLRAGCFTGVSDTQIHNTRVRLIWLPLFYRRERWGPERWNHILRSHSWNGWEDSEDGDKPQCTSLPHLIIWFHLHESPNSYDEVGWKNTERNYLILRFLRGLDYKTTVQLNSVQHISYCFTLCAGQCAL